MELTKEDRKEIEKGIAEDRALNGSMLGPHGAMSLLLLVTYDLLGLMEQRLHAIEEILRRNEIHASQ